MGPREISAFGYATSDDTAAVSGTLTVAAEKTIKLTPGSVTAAGMADGEVMATIETAEDASAARGDTGKAGAHHETPCRGTQRRPEPDGSAFRRKEGSG